MALEYNGQRIAAMQYNGVTIGEAMIDGQIVYRSIVTVTPLPPTFLDAAPWITLPTVEGVTYTVAGTPGYNQSVTVTATAQPGYELVGVSSWQHTFPSIEPVSGDYTGTAAGGQITIVATHTIEWDYEYVIEHTASLQISAFQIVAGIGVNNVIVTEGPPGQHSTATYTATLQAGDTVQIGLRNDLVGINLTATGTWSITPKGVLIPPTFHDGEPWITLPTVEGVTYSVSGTPGYEQSVTVTATAQPGYELVGTASWPHTFGPPPPRYTASDSGSYGQVGTTSWLTIATHAVTGDGPASGTWAVTRGNPNSLLSYGLRVLVDGAVVADTGYGRVSDPSHQSVAIPERQYGSGEIITFEARSGSISTNVDTWSWSLS